MTLVNGSTSCEYVALSCVWGKSDPGEPAPLHSSDHLPDGIPVAVEDSLMVGRRLGYRYLWVDKYCVQPTMNLPNEIRNMGKIYSNAVFTIIAAAGQDAAKGLPGVSTTPRVQQPRAGVKGSTLLSTMTQFEILVLLSKWQSRVGCSRGNFLAPKTLLHEAANPLSVRQHATLRNCLRDCS